MGCGLLFVYKWGIERRSRESQVRMWRCLWLSPGLTEGEGNAKSQGYLPAI